MFTQFELDKLVETRQSMIERIDNDENTELLEIVTMYCG